MTSFNALTTLQIGDALDIPPADARRPDAAEFTRADNPDGTGFTLSWRQDRNAVGYRIFRSQSYTEVPAYHMDKFYSGGFSTLILQFEVVPENRYGSPKIIDLYKRSTFQFYWVLAQRADGSLHEVQDLKIGPAPTDMNDRAHRSAIILQEPSPEPTTVAAPQPAATSQPATAAPAQPAAASPQPAASPAAAPAAPAPAQTPAQPAAPAPGQPAVAQPVAAAKPVTYIPYKAPGLFQILDVDGDVQSYSIYIGTERPTPEIAAGFWAGELRAGNPMRGYTFPAQLQGFKDSFHPEGQQAFLAIFALLADGSRVQPGLAVPPQPPGAMAELT